LVAEIGEKRGEREGGKKKRTKQETEGYEEKREGKRRKRKSGGKGEKDLFESLGRNLVKHLVVLISESSGYTPDRLSQIVPVSAEERGGEEKKGRKKKGKKRAPQLIAGKRDLSDATPRRLICRPPGSLILEPPLEGGPRRAPAIGGGRAKRKKKEILCCYIPRELSSNGWYSHQGPHHRHKVSRLRGRDGKEEKKEEKKKGSRFGPKGLAAADPSSLRKLGS